MCPNEYMGDVIGDMNKRRGRIMGMDQVNGLQCVSAEVPLGEMFKYATDLRSMTQARGSFTMQLSATRKCPLPTPRRSSKTPSAKRKKRNNLLSGGLPRRRKRDILPAPLPAGALGCV